MFEKIGIMKLSGELARHAAHRQSLTAQNVANADTPGFKAKDVSDFQASVAGTLEARKTHPMHLSFNDGNTAWKVMETNTPADPNGNTVSLDREILRSVEAERAHSRAVTIYQNSLDLMRTAIGRK